MPNEHAHLSNHFDDRGLARMVDVSQKPVTVRTAIAEAWVRVQPETMRQIRSSSSRKGDVLAVARLAAISGTKQTAMLIPLCHAIPVEAVDVDFDVSLETQVRCVVTVKTTARTGVEMEALCAASIAALTIYDMCKSSDRGMELGPIRLLEKSGGRTGDYHAPTTPPPPGNNQPDR
jgi:cyclic pyranopterin phosphate synthase